MRTGVKSALESVRAQECQRRAMQQSRTPAEMLGWGPRPGASPQVSDGKGTER